jgi:hypothetical protein
MVIVTRSVRVHGLEWTDILARDQLRRRDCAQRPQICRRFACRVFAGWPVDRVIRPACLRSRSHSISGSPMSRRCDGVLGSADLTDPPSGRARPRAGRGCADKLPRSSRPDPLGASACLRFNHLQPPFDKLKMRQAVLAVADQADFMTPSVPHRSAPVSGDQVYLA